VLREGRLTFLLADDTNKTLAYALRKSDSLAITAINRDESNSRTFDIPTASYLRDGVRLIEQRALHSWVGLQHRRKQRPVSAAHIDQSFEW